MYDQIPSMSFGASASCWTANRLVVVSQVIKWYLFYPYKTINALSPIVLSSKKMLVLSLDMKYLSRFFPFNNLSG